MRYLILLALLLCAGCIEPEEYNAERAAQEIHTYYVDTINGQRYTVQAAQGYGWDNEYRFKTNGEIVATFFQANVVAIHEDIIPQCEGSFHPVPVIIND